MFNETNRLHALPGISITVKPGSITSTMKEGGATGVLPEEFDAAVDGFEALLLAQATAGVAMDTPQMHEAVKVAVEAIVNQHS